MQCKVSLTREFSDKYFQGFYSLDFGGVPKLHWVFRTVLKLLGYSLALQNFSSLKYNWYRKVTYTNSERQVEHLPQEI